MTIFPIDLDACSFTLLYPHFLRSHRVGLVLAILPASLFGIDDPNPFMTHNNLP
ncbi:MAG TPA: hypothetical protein VHW70_13645 [Edaphobacter sp.]|nr:hypothetical protein [Edaphobacter sp.]